LFPNPFQIAYFAIALILQSDVSLVCLKVYRRSPARQFSRVLISSMSAFQRRACTLAAMAGLLIIVALYRHVEAHTVQASSATGFQDSHARPVRVQFIGESLCPDCAAFTTDVLDPVYRSKLKDIVDLDYVGWGNAKNSSGKVECQHGPRECKLNKALNCAQHYSRY
jgi:hypothetical protein